MCAHENENGNYLRNVGSGGSSNVLVSFPCLLAFPIPALSAYQCQTALEQETTNEEIAQADLELLSEALGLSKEQMCMKASSWIVLLAWDGYWFIIAHVIQKNWSKGIFSFLLFPSQLSSLTCSLNWKAAEHNLIMNFKVGNLWDCHIWI